MVMPEVIVRLLLELTLDPYTSLQKDNNKFS